MERKLVVLDRMVNREKAVLLLEEEKREYIVPLTKLPTQATPGSWFWITLDQGQVISVTLDPKKTAEAKQRVADKLTQLRQQQSSHFKR